MKIKTQLLIGNGIILILLCLISTTVLFSIYKLLDNTKWVEHTYKGIGKANLLTGYMIDQETGMRGFAVSGDEEFLEPYISGKKGFDNLIAELKNTVSDNPPQVQKLNEVELIANEWRSRIAEKYIGLRTDILAGEDLEREISNIIKSGVGKKNMDKIRDMLTRSGLSQSRQAQILVDMINMETGLRGYLLNEDEEYLEPYTIGKNQLDIHLTTYNAPMKLRDATYGWVNNYAERLIDLQEQESKTADMAEFYVLFSKKEGKQYMDRIRAHLDEFTSVERNLLVERLASQEGTAAVTRSVVIFGTLIVLTIGVFIILFMTRSITRIEGIVSKVASGDLMVNLKRKDGKSNVGILKSIEDMVHELNKIVSLLKQGVESIASASVEIKNSSDQLSEGASVQASSVEEVSASMEQMASNIQQNAQNAKQSESMAKKSHEMVHASNQSVTKTVESMDTIVKKNTIIREIARQTNLLALNAAVEASRAGDQGKSFAVVAAEIRKLAQESKEAVHEIDEISNTSEKVARTAGEMLNELVPEIEKTTKIVSEISAASMEQNQGANQINMAVQQLNSVVQENAASAEQLASNSTELHSQAELLNQTISFFKLEGRGSNGAHWSNESHDLESRTFEKRVEQKKELLNTDKKDSGFDYNLDVLQEDSDEDFEKY